MASAIDQKTQVSKTISWVPVIAIAVFILTPQLGLAAYAFWKGEAGFTLEGFSSLFESSAFFDALILSLSIAIVTIFVLILVLVPAVVAVQLWAPKLQGILNVLCTLPLVIPSIALVAGLMSILSTLSSQGRGTFSNSLSQVLQSDTLPVTLIGTYVVLCLPFTYRSINAALTSIPLRTYYEASFSLGAGTWKTLMKIVLPNIRGSIVFSAFFTFALSLGEYTVAATMSYQTLPVYMATLANSDFRASVALSLLSNIITWALLAFAMYYSDRRGKKSSKPTQSAMDQDAEGEVHDINQLSVNSLTVTAHENTKESNAHV
ncbi:ABC transporter permease subunit [Corynebacterium sp.]|uniref:ABC transporter permease n=1 Tax=Corynebacterium sp. TaxID=1720 RepID=UPI0028A98BCE|nr:ABC transporter permease subunit [Corynebacterium sp.]